MSLHCTHVWGEIETFSLEVGDNLISSRVSRVNHLLGMMVFDVVYGCSIVSK